MFEVILPGEFSQPPDRLGRRHVTQVQPGFRFTDVGVGLLQHRQKQLVLAFEVVEQALVDVGALGNAVHPRTAQAVLRKLVAGGQQDGLLRAVGIARAGFGGLGGFAFGA